MVSEMTLLMVSMSFQVSTSNALSSFNIQCPFASLNPMNGLNGREDLSSFVWPLDYQTLTQSNGQAKRTVHIVKTLLHNTKGPHMALLNYHIMPLEWCGLTPAELLMGHKIRTGLLHPKSSYIPIWTHI